MGPSNRIHFPALRVPISALALDATEGRFLLQGTTHVCLFDLDSEESGSMTNASEKRLLPLQTSARYIDCILEIQSQFRHSKSISSLVWWPQDTGAFLSASYDASVVLWDTETMEPSRVFRIQDRVYDLSVSPTATHTLIASATKATLYDLGGTQSHYLRLVDARTRHQDAILAVEWSPRDEYILASGGLDGLVHLWDVRSARSKLMSLSKNDPLEMNSLNPKPPRAHDGIVNGLAFTLSGDRLVSTGSDGTPRLWDMATGKDCQVIYQASLTNRDTTVHIFNVHSGEAVRPPLGPLMRPISSIAWRPRREQLVIAGSDGDMYLFEPPIPLSSYTQTSSRDPQLLEGTGRRTRRVAAASITSLASLEQQEEEEEEDDWS
ncbi:MAG: WD40-repeat-containing domain protein [Piptocephalis tieghemiana]|nr:MAG: WD40-repeat-containing domain protein [Piptocephalis tieghemiana]